MVQHIRNFLAVAALIAVAQAAWGAQVEPRRFSLPDRGSLRLEVPSSWQAQASPWANGKALRIVFASPARPSFKVLMTAVKVKRSGSPASILSGLRKRVARSTQRVKSKAAERAIPVQALKGPSSAGYYFSVTDKAPKPGGYKYMTQGAARIGPLTVLFTALRNDRGDSVAADTIAMVQSASYGDNRPPAQAGGVFHVQLSSIKTEAQAAKEAQRLARVHKSVIGSRKIGLMRRDLGQRGVYYRLILGPFGDRAAADEMCRKLAARKQGCIVIKP